jgi:hypothetical protein
MSMTGAPSFSDMMMNRSVVAAGKKLIVLGMDDSTMNNIGAIYQFISKEGPKAIPGILLLLLENQ